MRSKKAALLLATATGAVFIGTVIAQNAAPAAKPLISDDFESGVINTNLWDLRQAGAATVTIVQDKVAHGKNALKVHYPAGSSTRTWGSLAAKLPESLHDHLYGRAYVYMTGLPTWNHHVFLSAGTTGWPVSNFLEIGDENGQFKPSFQQNGPNIQRGETTAHQGAVPRDKWFCLEWEFKDQPKDEIVIWVDGQQVADKSFQFRGGTNGLVKGFSEFDFGFRTWARPNLLTNDVDVYYDDVAISDKPIGQIKP